MSELSVFRQMTSGQAELFNVLNREIGIKTRNIPFAKKAINALNTLGTLTQAEAANAADVFLDNLQTLNQGGITAEDHDKIDFVKRGKTITVSARVEAFYRAAQRKGYVITDKIVAVPKEDKATTYFREEFQNGKMLLVLEDQRKNTDRTVTAERLAGGYFAKIICRLTVQNIRSGMQLMTDCEMPISELLQIINCSEQGLYKTKWVEYKKPNGYIGKKKVVTDELNEDGFWYKWTGEMTNKTIIRRALKRIKEVLPELTNEIYAFESDEKYENIAREEAPKIEIEIPIEADNVDINKLTADQKEDVKETLELYKINPKLATDTAEKIKALIENGTDVQEVINTHYAAIVCLLKGKTTKAIIEPLLGDAVKGGKTDE